MQTVNIRQLKNNPSTALAAARDDDMVVVMNRDHPQALLIDLKQLGVPDLPAVRVALAVTLFRAGSVSAGFAARLADKPLAEMLLLLSSLGLPLTGDGTVLGTTLLRREPWRVETITEGWELFARYTLQGRRIEYAGGARLYAQETRSLRQSRTQRERWTAGRFAVLRLYWRRILTGGHGSLLERVDLLAELTHPGPVMRAWLGLLGCAVAALLRPWGWPVSAALFSTGALQPALYAALALRGHPEPGATISALARLPGYALWRGVVGVRAALISGRGAWTRTARHQEKLDRPVS